MRGVLARWEELGRWVRSRWRRLGDRVVMWSDRVEAFTLARLDRFEARRDGLEARLDTAAAASLRRWLRYVGLAVTVTATAALVLHLLLFVSLAGAVWLRWSGVTVVVLTALMLQVTVVRNVFISIAEPAQRRTLFVVSLSSAAVLLVSVEAFAAITAAIAGGPAQLWRAERFYLWHLVDSIPLVAIPRRLEWTEPALVTSIGGWLVLAFKIAVIAPLVRLVVALYELVEKGTREHRDVLMRLPVAFPRTSRFRAVKPATVVLVSAIVVVALLYGGLGPGTDAGRRIVSLSPAALAGTVPVIAVGALVLAAAVTAVTVVAVRAVDLWWDLVTEDATAVSVLTAVILVWVDTPLQLPPLSDALWGLELGRVSTTIVVFWVVGAAASLVWADPELPETIIALSLVLTFAGPRAPGINFLAHHVTWTPAGFAIGRAIGAASLALTGAYLLYQVSMMPRRVWRAGQITPFDPTGDLRERLCA